MTYERLAAELADRYRIEGELGRGGMAVVFLAQDLKHSRRVAVKILHSELGDTGLADRFFREIGIAARLAHPNILPLYDSGAAAGQLFYVTPYLEGESLGAWIKREKRLPLDVAVALAREIADALDYAHRNGVIHRDIKPDNVLISDGHAIVADFGIATALVPEESRLTRSGLVLGTPRYMSPEQALSDKVDGRSDIYSLACVLYECLVGEPPYSTALSSATGTRGPQDITRTLHAVQPSIPRHIIAAIQRGLPFLPDDRHERAADFRRALVEDPTSVRDSNHIFHIKVDGSDRRKIVSASNLMGVSPDGQSVAVSVMTSEMPNATLIYPLNGGAPTVICRECGPPPSIERGPWPPPVNWSPDGRFIYLDLYRSPHAVPLRPGQAVPELPPTGLRTDEEIAALPGAQRIPQEKVFPGPDPLTYAFSRIAIQRNIYRVPLK